jgi:hypothetical protein
MLERAVLAHVPCAWVTGDSVYGSDSEAENESTFAHRVTDARNLPATVACRRGYTPFT